MASFALVIIGAVLLVPGERRLADYLGQPEERLGSELGRYREAYASAAVLGLAGIGLPLAGGGAL